MPSEPPPPRYRVTERGRRLDVIDTWADRRPPPVGARSASTTRREARSLGTMARTSFDGRAELTTSPLYDLNGPRTIALDPMSAKIFAGSRLAAVALVIAWIAAAVFVPALFVLIVPFLTPKTWKPIREKTTAWLDRAAVEKA